MYSRTYVEITNICNMRCSFCHGHSRAPRRMRREEFAEILRQLKGYTNYIYYHLMGEPLTHPDLPEFLTMAKESGFRSVITTNGTLLSRRGAEILAAGVHKVSISLHSFEGQDNDAHESYIRQIAEFSQAAADCGTIISLRLWNKGHDGGRNDDTLSLLRRYLPGEWAPNTRGYRVREHVYLEWGERFTWPDKDAPIQSDQVYCYGLKDHFGILCDGTVVPCCLDSDGVIALGNVFSQPLANILSSDRAQRIAAGFAAHTAYEDLCRRCPYATRGQSSN